VAAASGQQLQCQFAEVETADLVRCTALELLELSGHRVPKRSLTTGLEGQLGEPSQQSVQAALVRSLRRGLARHQAVAQIERWFRQEERLGPDAVKVEEVDVHQRADRAERRVEPSAGSMQ